MNKYKILTRTLTSIVTYEHYRASDFDILMVLSAFIAESNHSPFHVLKIERITNKEYEENT